MLTYSIGKAIRIVIEFYLVPAVDVVTNLHGPNPAKKIIGHAGARNARIAVPFGSS